MTAHTQSPFLNTTWISTDKNGNTVIAIHAQPGAKKTTVTGLFNDRLKIALASPPVDGKANTTLIKFLSKTLRIPKASIQILSGETSREKRLIIRGLAIDELLTVLKKTFPSL